MREVLRISTALLATTALLLACVVGPMLLAQRFHPAAGSIAALVAAVVWTRLIRPRPGFVQGIICISGLGAIEATLLICLVSWVSVAIGWRPSSVSIHFSAVVEHGVQAAWASDLPR